MITDACPRARRKKFHAGNIFVLTESEHTEVNPGETPLYRYQSGETLLGEILQNCGQELRTAGEISAEKEAKCEGDRCLFPGPPYRKTSYALQMGQKIGVSAHTLYLNMELYGGVGGHFPEEGSTMQMRCTIPGWRGRIWLDADRDGSAIWGPFGLSAAGQGIWRILRQSPAKDWEQLLRQILTEGMYEAVILDLDEGIQVYTDCSGCVQRFMCRCSRIGSELLKCSSLKKSCICLDMMMSERSFKKRRACDDPGRTASCQDHGRA